MQPESQNVASAPRKLNVAGAIKGVFVGILMGFMAGLLTVYVSWYMFWLTIVIFAIIGAIIGAKSSTRAEEKAQFISNDGLTGTQKTLAWLFSILNPVIAGAVMYFMWRHDYPTKAKQANNISIIMFLIWIVIGAIIFFYKP